MVGSSFSLIPFYKNYLCWRFTYAGLSPQFINTDNETTIQFWAPTTCTTKPALVLLHGTGPGGTWHWNNQVAFFAPHYALYIPDLLFYGQSKTNNRDRTEIFQAETVAKMMEKLGLSKYSVVGTSYGGFVAYRMAKMHPEKVEKVVLANCAINRRPSDTRDLVILANAESYVDLLVPKSGKHFKTLLGLSMMKPSFAPEFILNDVVRTLYGGNRDELVRLIKNLTFGQDDIVKCEPLQQDTLLLWGQYDQIFRLERAFELKEILGERAKLEVIKDTGHLPHIEDPYNFNELVMKFLISIDQDRHVNSNAARSIWDIFCRRSKSQSNLLPCQRFELVTENTCDG